MNWVIHTESDYLKGMLLVMENLINPVNNSTYNTMPYGFYCPLKKVIISLLMLALHIATINSVHADENQTKEDKCSPIKNTFEKRACSEKILRHQPYVLIPYKPNYFIYSWVDNLNNENSQLYNHEAKFQISFKVPINEHEADTNWLWFLGYTQHSVWQMTNFDHSAPFRDTNFEPELMVARLSNARLFDWKLRLINFGLIDHQSNGQSPPDSRSWNRSYIDLFMERGSNYITFKTWHHWNEAKKTDPAEFRGDDNPDIEDYVGHGELKLFHVGESNNTALTLRDIHHSNRLASFQFDWSYPIGSKRGLRFYVQYFNGYGETLIDYNIKRERFGMGIMLTDWL